MNQTGSLVSAKPYFTYTIRKGNQFCDQNAYKAINTTEMKFVAIFDSSAVYKTVSPADQNDINKLYGFSDNNADHHQFSARFGWRWSDSALRLFAYVYNQGSVSYKELGPVPIGSEINCSIKVEKDDYVFSCNANVIKILRTSTTKNASGYQLYPYFGGEEPAPHDITIRIKEVP